MSIIPRSYDEAISTDPRDSQPEPFELPARRYFDCERCEARVTNLYPRDCGEQTKAVCGHCADELDGIVSPDPDAQRDRWRHDA